MGARGVVADQHAALPSTVPPDREPGDTLPPGGQPVVGSTAAAAWRWFALAALVVLLWAGRSVLPPFVVAGVLAYILSPLANALSTRVRIPRPWSALLVFLSVVGVLGIFSWLLGARLAAEVRALLAEGPNLIETIAVHLTGGQPVVLLGQEFAPRDLAAYLSSAAAGWIGGPAEALHVVRQAMEWGLDTLLMLVALAYLLVDGSRMGRYSLRFFPAEHREHVARLADEIHRVLGRYLRGQLALVLLMATVTFMALEWLFHLPYALPIALATGVLEIIPLVGPVTAGAIACGVGFVQGGLPEAGALALLYFVLRQGEDQLVMPQVVGRAVQVHPLVTIFAVLLGEQVAGVLGMLLGVPLAAAAKVVLDYAYPPGEPAGKDRPAAGRMTAN
jgi:predicted PurR-regulated permease PerM